MTSAQQLNDIMLKKNYTLSIAESCTGGLISSMITAIPGVSAWFAGGVITYSTKSKTILLGIDNEHIIKHGVVSDYTCKQMAEKIRLTLNTDIGVAITGNAGPSFIDGSLPGTAFIGLSMHENISFKQVKFNGNRILSQNYFAQQCIEFVIYNMTLSGAL